MMLRPDRHEILSKNLTLGPDNEMLKTALTLQAPKYNPCSERKCQSNSISRWSDCFRRVGRGCTVYSFDHDLAISYFHFES